MKMNWLKNHLWTIVFAVAAIGCLITMIPKAVKAAAVAYVQVVSSASSPVWMTSSENFPVWTTSASESTAYIVHLKPCENGTVPKPISEKGTYIVTPIKNSTVVEMCEFSPNTGLSATPYKVTSSLVITGIDINNLGSESESVFFLSQDSFIAANVIEDYKVASGMQQFRYTSGWSVRRSVSDDGKQIQPGIVYVYVWNGDASAGAMSNPDILLDVYGYVTTR
jgi:hypothetical protein